MLYSQKKITTLPLCEYVRWRDSDAKTGESQRPGTALYRRVSFYIAMPRCIFLVAMAVHGGMAYIAGNLKKVGRSVSSLKPCKYLAVVYWLFDGDGLIV